MLIARAVPKASIDDSDLNTLIAQAHAAWVERGGPKVPEVEPKPPARQRPKKRPPPVPPDIPTALAWYDEVQRFRALHPRPATPGEIAHLYALHQGRYAPTKFELPLADMDAFKLSVMQWRDVFARADRYLHQKKSPPNTPPPFALFLKIAQTQAQYRDSVRHKERQLALLRRRAPQEPR